MNGDVETEAPRPRPLSGGLWTLFSWLRRDDRASSSESLSSAGSDRTAASFAFLAPAHYRAGTTPLVLPPPGPPTDSYKKRVHERNLRRQYDRDITLHRKYGLYRSEGGNEYDGFSLPQVRRPTSDSIRKWDRERRAASECLQGRVVHVPGKRRAPLPPVRASSAGPSASLTRRTRKRPAPQPPVKSPQKTKENISSDNRDIPFQMSSQSIRDEPPLRTNDSMECKPEKYSKKEVNSKDVKTRSDKSFLKQIFENRKRNSTIETTPIKILPSISELDKQAAELIENSKLKKALQQTDNEQKQSKSQGSTDPSITESWFCTRCLRKYNGSVSACLYCLPEQKRKSAEVNKLLNCKNIALAADTYTQTENGLPQLALSQNHGAEEKQKLKKMLKEMKDSLPKRAKHDHNDIDKTKISISSKLSDENKLLETPTLRIGSVLGESENVKPSCSSASNNNNKKVPLSTKTKPSETNKTVLITQHVVLEHAVNLKDSVKLNESYVTNPVDKMTINSSTPNDNSHNNSRKENLKSEDSKRNNQKLEMSSTEKRKLHTPLKISSLLNPVYVPKNKISGINLPERPLQKESSGSDSPKNNTQKPMFLITAMGNVEASPSTTYTTTSQQQAHIGNVDAPRGKFKQEMKKVTEEKEKPTSEKNNFSKTNAALIKVSEYLRKDKKVNNSFPATSLKECNSMSNVEKVNQHTRRRELINQLEQSIAKGDENAAAEAAVKLAQLRLSCSVLSFSSQIVSEPSTSSSNNQTSTTTVTLSENDNVVTNVSNKIECTTGQPMQTPLSSKIIAPVSPSTEIFTQNGSKNDIKPVSTVKENISVSSVLKPESLKSKLCGNKTNLIAQNSAPTEASTSKQNESNKVSIVVLVEDKEAARGPIELHIERGAIMGELRRQAETALGLPTRLQRWIIGRTLCTDDNTPLVSLAGPEFNAPFYLCVVEAEAIPKSGYRVPDDAIANAQKPDDKDKAANFYTELVQLEQQALLPNAEMFECGVCMEECISGGGVVLRECVHTFCRECLADVVRHCEEPDVTCPAMGCRGMLQEREIRALVSEEDYERWLARGLAAAESGTRNAFHCRTRDCTGWALCEPGVLRFPCPVCKCNNCVPCQAIHEGETCEQYRVKLEEVAKVDSSQIDDSTRALLNTLIRKGEALECPECKAIITKKWGCDWVKCSACKTEICWVTRGRRWGPGGRGDVSGGCRCGVDGKRCHPSCGYCH